jgi:hypothetical protein
MRSAGASSVAMTDRPRDRLAPDDPNRRPAGMPTTPDQEELVRSLRRDKAIARARAREAAQA